MSLPRIRKQRKIIDRRALSAAIAQVVADQGALGGRQDVVAALRKALDAGRETLRRRLAKRPGAGHEHANGQAFLIDQLIRVVHDHVIEDIYPAANRSSGERIALLAVGGYGRGEMAPFSDIDIAFITPGKPTSWCEQVIEAILYYLWDLGLKVGHSTRSLDEAVRMAKADLTIRTALLEARFLWGDQDLYDAASAQFWNEIVPGSEGSFVQEKLAERNARHKRMGDSRYVVEPNVKDGKGGLRDLQTLYWMGKYVHRVRSAAELVQKGLFTEKEYRSFRRAERFLLAVRAHLHTIAKRAEDRLTFDLQREVAARMNYADRPGKSAVERFMQFYFLQAKHVGHLTGVFLAQLEEQTAERSRLSDFVSAITPRRTCKVEGYLVEANRIAAPSDDWFQQDPVRLLEIFAIAEREGLEVHPATIRIARRDAALVTAEVRKDRRANDLFMQVLAGRNDPETVLRWMNEAGVFGRFVPDFGKVGGQMQFDMYHHYTVDEHTIRAIGLLSAIERGALKEDHPLASRILQKLGNRRVLFLAVLLHDIAKGRGGDHSVLGADVARKLCPRLGLDAKETELVAWLVRYHLLMSAFAFKRDLSDPKTIIDFVAEVQSLERLRLLTVLTIVDIRAVGPGIWNSWKRQLLADLFDAAQERLRLGHKSHGRAERVAAKKARVRDLLGDKAGLVEDLAEAFADAYWIAEPEDVIALNLPHYAAAQEMQHTLSIHTEYDAALGATLVTVIGDDHPGLFYRIAGAIHLAGGNIIDARIHTNRAGKALDNFVVQDPMGRPFREETQLARLKTSIADALAGKIDMVPRLAKRPLKQMRAENFRIAADVSFDNAASNRFTVIEVNATDRPALLNRLTRALYEQSLLVNSAHITHYGERAVDTFYVTDLTGMKVDSPSRLKKVARALLDAIAAGEGELADAAA
ncbi:[protein-PII] uridylyltransferase [Aurantiacibacter aquimixticola]|uniref:Bifunctional uridylyltransferase/uridylyl-removing enzyme n=1 Tax=Aurantiacibacter aquimixticola TaxID=1958945 RepID=A0A419RUD3_9SPHN|nr:[protein-PII] uridylyltransferase [Aurantiacibacter aquimixticola]RJY09389.1 [protein-PII] uridylyltransferase [Aurantiacibacter aquimixticola]